MTQQVRTNFLNWRPDREALGNDGLTVAENVIHDSDGYKPLHKQSAGAFATTSAFTATFGLAVKSVYLKPLSKSDRHGVAALVALPGPMVALALGVTEENVFGIAGTNSATLLVQSQVNSSTLLSAGACRLLSFSIAELEGAAVFVAQAEADLAGGTVQSLNASGIVDYTVD
jgi:hypothetical protein